MYTNLKLVDIISKLFFTYYEFYVLVFIKIMEKVFEAMYLRHKIIILDVSVKHSLYVFINRFWQLQNDYGYVMLVTTSAGFCTHNSLVKKNMLTKNMSFAAILIPLKHVW